MTCFFLSVLKAEYHCFHLVSSCVVLWTYSSDSGAIADLYPSITRIESPYIPSVYKSIWFANLFWYFAQSMAQRNSPALCRSSNDWPIDECSKGKWNCWRIDLLGELFGDILYCKAILDPNWPHFDTVAWRWHSDERQCVVFADQIPDTYRLCLRHCFHAARCETWFKDDFNNAMIKWWSSASLLANGEVFLHYYYYNSWLFCRSLSKIELS